MNPHYHEQIRQINTAISRTSKLYEEWSKRNDIPYYAMLIFYSLMTNEAVTQKLIREEYRIPKQTINNVIADLKKQGQIVLEPNPENMREKLIRLTDTGRHYAEAKIGPLLEVEDKMIERMGAEATAQLIATAMRYGDLFEEELLAITDETSD